MATTSVRFTDPYADDDDHHNDADNEGESGRSTGSSTDKHRAARLRGNLTRELKDRDPLFYYEVVNVLGVGSMGSVAKVQKRQAVLGGSARTELVKHYKHERRLKDCFAMPLVGGMFQFCFKGQMDSRRQNLLSRNSSILNVSENFQGSSNGSNNGDDDNANSQDEHSNSATNTASSATGYQVFRAMKSIHLSRVTDPVFVEELKNEIAILKKLDHPHIVKAMETYEHRNQIFIVMELCSGGDLYSRDPYTEAEAARIVTSVVSAIAYMHSKNICHRDLKYENIMFVNNDPRAEVKLIDFGLSAKFAGADMTEGVGTIYTMAPEVLKGSYTNQADMWSIGVITFMLLSSQMPFYGRKRRHIVEQVMAGKFEFKGRRWKRISEQAKAFCEELLVVDPEERADAEQALSMAWLNRRFTATVRNPYEEEIQNANANLLKYAKYAKIKKIALMIVSHKSTTSEIGILRKVFQKYDTKKDGQLSYEEFKAALKDAGYSEDQYRSIFDAVDLDGTGKIRYTEFLAATIEAQGAISEERLAEAFDRMDADDSGFISKENLSALLGEEFPQSEINAIIDEADITRDGKISYSEFLALWEDKNEGNRQKQMQEVKDMAITFTNGSHSVGSERTGDSFSDSDMEIDVDPMAKTSFRDSKRNSERKAHVVVPEDSNGGRKVMFGPGPVSTIPSTVGGKPPHPQKHSAVV